MKSNIKYSTNELLKYIELYLEGVSLRELRDDYQLIVKQLFTPALCIAPVSVGCPGRCDYRNPGSD